MIELNQVKQILHANGLQETSSEAEIRELLKSARLSEDEIILALNALTNQTSEVTVTSGSASSRKLFRTNEHLQPADISKLLGINVVVNEIIIAKRPKQGFSFLQFFVLWLTSVIIAAVAVLGYMYSQKIGVFHPAMEDISLYL